MMPNSVVVRHLQLERSGKPIFKAIPQLLVVLTDTSSRSPPRSGSPVSRLGIFPRILRAALYGILAFISFFVMLIFMTYNASNSLPNWT